MSTRSDFPLHQSFEFLFAHLVSAFAHLHGSVSRSRHYTKVILPLQSPVLKLLESVSMEVNSILFLGKSGGLPQTTALEARLKHFKKKLSLKDFRVNFHPRPAFPAFRQILIIFGDPGESHGPSMGF